MKSAFLAILIIWVVLIGVMILLTFLAYKSGLLDRRTNRENERTEIIRMYEDYKDEPYLPGSSIDVFSTKELFCEIIRRIRNQ